MKTRKRPLVTEKGSPRSASSSPAKKKRPERKEVIDTAPAKATKSKGKEPKLKQKQKEIKGRDAKSKVKDVKPKTKATKSKGQDVKTKAKDIKSMVTKSKKKAGKGKVSKPKGKEAKAKTPTPKSKEKVIQKAPPPPVQQTGGKRTVVLNLSPAYKSRRRVVLALATRPEPVDSAPDPDPSLRLEIAEGTPEKKQDGNQAAVSTPDNDDGSESGAGWIPADEPATPEPTTTIVPVKLTAATAAPAPAENAEPKATPTEPRPDDPRTDSPGDATANKKDGAREDPVSNLELEEDLDHNYSKDPRGELMKMNLPIYACSMCKKYTFDPQQSALHSRKVHNAKVGIILMLPLAEIQSPHNSSIVETQQPPPEDTSPLPSSPLESLVPNSSPKSMQDLPKVGEPSELVGREKSVQKTFECGKCFRQFFTEGGLGKHKCSQLMRQSPRRVEGDKGSYQELVSFTPVQVASSLRTSGSSRARPKESLTPVKQQKDKVTSEAEKNGKEDLEGKIDENREKEDTSKGANDKVEMRMLEELKQKELELRKDSVNKPEIGIADDEDDFDDEDLELDDEQVEISDINIEYDGEVSVAAKNIGEPEPLDDPSVNDEMMLQWEGRGPPTAGELDKFIKPVQGGLQSGEGEPILFYMCVICRNVFKSKNVLRPHLFSHLGYRPYSCATCGYCATHNNALQAHKKNHLVNRFKCYYRNCKYVGKKEDDLKKHRLSHVTSVKCGLCRGSFRSRNTLLGHLCISHAEEIKDGNGKKFYTRIVMTGRRASQIVLFQCNICGRKSKSKKGYYAHIRTHSAIKGASLPPASEMRKKKSSKSGVVHELIEPVRAQCPMCETVVYSDHMVKHIITHPFIYRCSMCEEKFLTYGSLNEHVGSHSYVAEFNPQEKINESLRKSFYLNGEMDKALEADKVQWAQRRTGALAPKSAMTGSVFDDLMSKISIPTEDVPKEELQELGEPFSKLKYKRLTPSILRYIHMRFGNVECGVCGKLFGKVGLCKEHTKKHNKLKEFKCEKCPYQSSVKATLQKHMSTAHGEGEKFFCELCKNHVIGKEVYESHLKRHAANSEGPITCTWCNTTTEKKDDMKKHIVDTHPLMPLAESTKILGIGVVIHRDKGAPFLVCEVCSETFRRICDLRRHMWKHSAVKRFTCDICDYGSDKRTNIVSHMRKHSEEKAHQCDCCGKAYKTEQSLKLHVRSTHLKLKPYKCDLCDYAAAQPVHLRRHKFLHHSEGDRKRFNCAICPEYTASDLQIIRRHYKKKHPTEKVTLSKCCPAGFKSPSLVRKDKHQVIQVVPSLPAVQEQEQEVVVIQDSEEPGSIAEELVVEDQEGAHRSMSPAAVDEPGTSIEIDNQTHQITENMTVEVILPEDQAQLLNINSALPDVINALAALQEKDFVH